MPSDPTAVQTVQVAIDALVGPAVRPFWRAVLGYRDVGDEELVAPHGRGPSVWFQQMDAPRPQRNRAHIDISVPHDQAKARIAAAIAAGGRLVTDRYAPSWWVLADAEGNEARVATWMGRDSALFPSNRQFHTESGSSVKIRCPSSGDPVCSRVTVVRRSGHHGCSDGHVIIRIPDSSATTDAPKPVPMARDRRSSPLPLGRRRAPTQSATRDQRDARIQRAAPGSLVCRR